MIVVVIASGRSVTVLLLFCFQLYTVKNLLTATKGTGFNSRKDLTKQAYVVCNLLSSFVLQKFSQMSLVLLS